MRAISWTMKKKVGRKYIKALSEEKVSVFCHLYFYILFIFLHIETIGCFAKHLFLFFSFTITPRKFCSSLRNSVFSCTWVPQGACGHQRTAFQSVLCFNFYGFLGSNSSPHACSASAFTRWAIWLAQFSKS